MLDLLRAARRLAWAACAISKLIGLPLSAAMAIIYFISDLSGLVALTIDCSFFSASDSLAVLDESLSLDRRRGTPARWETLERREASTTSKVSKAATEEILAEATHASHASHAAHAAEAWHASKSTETKIVSKWITLLLSLFSGSSLASSATHATESTETEVHEIIVIIKERGERISPSEEISEDILRMLERKARMVKAAERLASRTSLTI